MTFLGAGSSGLQSSTSAYSTESSLSLRLGISFCDCPWRHKPSYDTLRRLRHLLTESLGGEMALCNPLTDLVQITFLVREFTPDGIFVAYSWLSTLTTCLHTFLHASSQICKPPTNPESICSGWREELVRCDNRYFTELSSMKWDFV